MSLFGEIKGAVSAFEIARVLANAAKVITAINAFLKSEFIILSL